MEWRGQGARWLQVWLPVWRDREATSRFFGFNFIEENLRGLEPDVAILAENSNHDWSEAIKILRPKTVIVHHYDDWRVPLSSGMTAAARRRAQRLGREVKSVDRKIRVIIPEFLETITLK